MRAACPDLPSIQHNASAATRSREHRHSTSRFSQIAINAQGPYSGPCLRRRWDSNQPEADTLSRTHAFQSASGGQFSHSLFSRRPVLVCDLAQGPVSGPCLRRRWDSNPRYAFTYTRFPGVPVQPLLHLSVDGFPAVETTGQQMYGFSAFYKSVQCATRKRTTRTEIPERIRAM
jgi:hypothetical protein